MTEYSNRALSRGLLIMDVLASAPRGMLLTEIAKGAELDRTTTYRLLHVLSTHGYVHRDSTTKRYAVKFKLNRPNKREFPNVAAKIVRPALKELYDGTHAAVSVASLLGSEVCYYQEFLGRDQIAQGAELYRGKRLPAHATACGKALLADLTPIEFSRIYEFVPLHVYTSNTVRTIGELRDNLRVGLERGYAISDGEFQPDRFCMAVPVRVPSGMSRLAISATVPIRQAQSRGLTAIIDRLRSTAERAARMISNCGLHPSI